MCKESEKYQVEHINKIFYDKKGGEVTGCALMYSKNFKELFGSEMKDATIGDLEGIIKISSESKTVYRKFYGIGMEKQKIQLSYRTIAALKIKEGDKVIVEKGCWFPYLWNHYDSSVRWTFISGVVGLCCSIVLGLASIALSIYSIVNCCG